MSVDPKISVVMPASNAEPWLAEAIESILGQTLPEFELIVVDDGSTDRSADIISALSQRDDRIHALRHPQRQGLVSALNTALAVARAPLLARLDADDIALPERLSRQAECFAEQSTLVLLGSWAERIDEQGHRIGAVRPETKPERLRQILQQSNPFVHSSIMMRTDLLRRLGGYRHPFLGAEDFDLWLRMSEHGVIANLPETLVRYRVHGGNVSRRLGVRQCFSARLARAAAVARRSSAADPADRLSGPPDWWAPEAAHEFYAEAAQICRFLELADRGVLAAHGTDGVQLPNVQQILGLSHAEKKLARRCLFNLLTERNRPAGLPFGRLAFALATLHIGRAIYPPKLI